MTPSDARVGDLTEGAVLRSILERLPPTSALLGPGDDAALLAAPDGRVVATVDTLVHGPDFRLAWSSAHDLGWKAAAVNLADIAAMGARPTGLLVALAMPDDTRLSFVGGAGSSLVAAGGPRLVDTPDFHEEWKAEALAHAAVLDALRETPAELRWFYVSPAALFGSFAPGEATGSYRTGGDLLVTKEDGSSEISGADFALAYVDEIEQGRHPRQRFTTGY